MSYKVSLLCIILLAACQSGQRLPDQAFWPGLYLLEPHHEILRNCAETRFDDALAFENVQLTCIASPSDSFRTLQTKYRQHLIEQRFVLQDSAEMAFARYCRGLERAILVVAGPALWEMQGYAVQEGGKRIVAKDPTELSDAYGPFLLNLIQGEEYEPLAIVLSDRGCSI